MKRLWFLPAILLLAGPAWADELKTLDNKSVTGALEKITDTEVTIKSGGNSVATPLSKILELTLRPGKTAPEPFTKYIDVRLLDGSQLSCSKITFTAKDADLTLTTGATVKVPLTALLTVLREADNENLRTQWAKLLTDKKRVDRIFILKEGELNPLVGTLGAINEKTQTISFKLESGTKIEPELEKVHGLQFTPTEAAPEARLCRVIDVDGSTLVAAKVASSGETVTVTTPFGQKVSFEAKSIAKFDFNFGRFTYLSDLDSRITEPVFLAGFAAVRKDVNLDGTSIILGDKKYDKGLSMYAGVELEYGLGGKYKDFKAVLGVDSRIAEEGQGKVMVSVFCDKEKHTFEVSTKAPTPISINVKDVNTLRIVVTGANFTNLSGHAMLANAHVSQ